MKCPNCGRNEPSEDACFCPRCGQQLVSIPTNHDNYDTYNKKRDFNIYRVIWDYWWLISLFLGVILIAVGFYIISIENLASLADPTPWILLIVGFMLFIVGSIRVRVIVQRKLYDE